MARKRRVILLLTSTDSEMTGTKIRRNNNYLGPIHILRTHKSRIFVTPPLLQPVHFRDPLPYAYVQIRPPPFFY